ncbi:putative integral membrane protein [Friedmanniella endophytica]|uniref:Putative integral membrane protein n=1 Tax=Microlunatus kandeliicorticis TaxID=1759536 RepID=A0A7W3INU5_9ACTN|nr:putative integral membrane protein [Microlunatus kandeliicorticis]
MISTPRQRLAIFGGSFALALIIILLLMFVTGAL